MTYTETLARWHDDALGWLVGVTNALLLTALRNTWDLLVTVADHDES